MYVVLLPGLRGLGVRVRSRVQGLGFSGRFRFLAGSVFVPLRNCGYSYLHGRSAKTRNRVGTLLGMYVGLELACVELPKFRNSKSKSHGNGSSN